MARLTVRKLAARVRELPSSVQEPDQSKSGPYLDIESRWEPCLHLYQAGVPYKVWTEEDVFHFHGLYRYRDSFPDPYAFQTSDIAILVNDLEGAAAILEGSGYFRTPKSSAEQEAMGYSSGNRRSKRDFVRLLNVSAMVQFHSQWDSSEDIINKVVYAAGIADNPNRGPAQVAGNGVLLMLASDWNYTLSTKSASSYYHDPIPELSDYFDSHVSLWMDTSISLAADVAQSLSNAARSRYYANILKVLVCETDETWTIEFEKDIKSKHRQALFDLLEMGYQWMAKEGVCIVACLTTDADFQTYSKYVRDQIKAGVHEPVFMADLHRFRMKSAVTLPLPRGQASIRDENECKKDLPKLSWLVRAPRGNKWLLLSLNLARILANKRQERLNKRSGLSSRKWQPKRKPDQVWTLEYHLQDVMADTENWAYQNQEEF